MQRIAAAHYPKVTRVGIILRRVNTFQARSHPSRAEAMVDRIVEPGEIIDFCRTIAKFSEQPGCTTRTFLSPPMRDVHQFLGAWMERLGMRVSVDSAGNLRGRYASAALGARRLLIGSHLDTVPCAGPFDGVLGVVLGVALVESLRGRHLPFDLEIVAFSEEEGVRFGVPFIGSRALVGRLDADLLAAKDAAGISVAQAMRDFTLDVSALPVAEIGDTDRVLGYLEFHIEQGPVLDNLNLPLGVVEAIVGQSRHDFVFFGRANHAGTTPMNLRSDALAGAAEWVVAVENMGRAIPGLVATVGEIAALPGASNVIPGEARASLDVRHASDRERLHAVRSLMEAAAEISRRRNLEVRSTARYDQATVSCDAGLVAKLEKAVIAAGYPLHRMMSGAGHDAMILAEKVPIAMLFMRSPGGLSHHPDECVLAADVAAALRSGLCFLSELETLHG
jgi:allantoate deiminase